MVGCSSITWQIPHSTDFKSISNRCEGFITFSLLAARVTPDMVQRAEGGARFVASRSSELCPVPACRGAAPQQDGMGHSSELLDATKRAPPSAL